MTPIRIAKKARALRQFMLVPPPAYIGLNVMVCSEYS